MSLRPLANPTLAVVAVVYGFLLTIAGAAGFFGIALGVSVILSLCRYGYNVLRNTARGRNNEGAPDIDSMNPVGDYRLVLHSILFALLPVLAARASSLPFSPAADAALTLGAAVLACAYPASAAWLALTSDLAGAMTPRNVWRLIAIMGRRYLLLAGVCTALLLLADRLPVLLPLPWFLATPVSRILSVWAALAVFALTGAEIRAHRHRFEIPGELEPEEERRARELRAEWQKTLDLAYASLRSGLRQQGYRTVEGLVEREHGSLEVQQWIFDRMLTWEDKGDALAFAHRLVASLLLQRHRYDALEIVTRCRRVSPAFAPHRAAAADLAEFARSIGRQGLADELAAAAASGEPAAGNAPALDE